MDLENNENNPSDISNFLDQFEKENSELEKAFAAGKVNFYTALDPKNNTSKPADKEKDQSFKKLEDKVSELEQKFETSLKEKQVLMSELAASKEEKEKEKGREEFFNNISSTIANLKESVDRLSRAQQMPAGPSFISPGYYYGAPIDQASKFGQENYFKQQHELAQSQVELAKTREENFIKQGIISNQQEELSLNAQTISAQKQEIEQHKSDKEEKERFINSLKEKASRLKAVNSALEKEFKRVQDEKIEALRKSAEQAKEILSLRDQLTKAEERFKSFDFEGRILSIKNHYQQKVSKLETQLQEMSAVCMKQVEEIESLKTDSLRLQKTEEELKALNAKYDAKTQEVARLKSQVEQITKASTEALMKVSSEKDADSQKVLEQRTQQLMAINEQKINDLLQQRQADAARAEKEKEELKNKISELETLKAGHAAASVEISKKALENEELKNKVAELETLKAQLAAENENATGAAMRHSMETEALKERINDLERFKASHAAAAGSAEAEVLLAKQEAQNLKEEISSKEAAYAAAAEEKVKSITQKANEEISALNARLLQVQGERDAIAGQIKEVSTKEDSLVKAEKERYESMLKTLMQKIKENDSVIEKLKGKIEVLDNENKSLKTPKAPAAPAAKSAVPSAPEKTEFSAKEEDAPAAAPVYPDARNRGASRAKAAALGDAYEGEKDFLEDTQTFLGRIKWSLMKED
ncbi:chromosome segregation ATPase [Elusimicrobium posterum]|uniref:hypothetical protein n=1 Tax=Elusimicrobium posterum TaxID=3116653 RepID=UPI003C747383